MASNASFNALILEFTNGDIQTLDVKQHKFLFLRQLYVWELYAFETTGFTWLQ